MMRRHVISCSGVKGDDASDNGEDNGGGYRRRNDVGSGNNSIDVDLGVLDKAEAWIISCDEIKFTLVAPVDMDKD